MIGKNFIHTMIYSMAGDIQIKYERKIILDTIQFIIHINNLHHLVEKLIIIHNTVLKHKFYYFY